MSKKNQIGLLIAVLGIAAAVLSYYFLYQKMEQQTATLNAESASMEEDIAKYQEWEANREVYVAETEQMQQQIAERINEFPSNALVEDDVKLAYELDNDFGSDYRYINGMTFAAPAAVYTTDYSAADSVAQESGVVMDITSTYPRYTLFDNVVNYNLSSTYTGLKDMVAKIYALKDKRGITAVTLGYDNANGLLNGSLTMDTYYVFGSDKPYSQPSLTPVEKGTENPFGTLDEYDRNAVLTETEEAAEESAAQ